MFSRYAKIIITGFVLALFLLPSYVYAEAPPQVTAFSLTPKVVNTTSESQEITVTLNLKDDFAGVGNAFVALRPEVGSTQSLFIGTIRVAGDALNGTYKGSAKLPIGSQKGIWSVSNLYLSDKIANYKDLNKSDLESLFGSGSASFTNEADDDTSAPQITSFNLSPKTVNTESESQEVTLTMTLKDDFAGVGQVWIHLRPEAGSTQIVAISGERVAGDALNGTYKGTTKLPVGSQKGIWSARLYLYDTIYNYKYLSKSGLESRFGQGSASITNTATFDDTTPPEFGEPGDPSAPHLTHFTLTPRVVSTRNSDQRLNLMVHLTDDKEGVYAIGDLCSPTYAGPPTMMRLRPDAGGNEKIDFFLERISGDDLKGVYRARPIMPKGSTEGVWRVEYLYQVDKKGNHRYLSADKIDALLPGRQYTTIINRGQEGVGPKTYVKGYSAKTISKQKGSRYLKLYRHYRGKYTKTRNRTLRNRYKKAANKYLKAYRDANKKVVTASLSWKVKDHANKAYVKLKIQKRVKSKLRVKKKARYLKTYRKYRGKYIIYKKKYRKTRNRTLRKRYQRAAVKYKKAMNKYLRAYRGTKTVVFKLVKTANYRWTGINKWRSYNFRTRSRGTYRYYVYAKNKAGNNQQNIAKGSFRIK